MGRKDEKMGGKSEGKVHLKRELKKIFFGVK